MIMSCIAGPNRWAGYATGRLFAEMTEVNREIDGLYEIINNLYQSNTKLVNYESSRNGDIL